MQLGQRIVDNGRAADFLHREFRLELRVGIVHGVAMVFGADARERGSLGAVLLHVFAAGVAEHLRGPGSFALPAELIHQRYMAH